MKTKLTMASIAMGAILLTGCGGGSGDTPGGGIQNSLLGTWDAHNTEDAREIQSGLCNNHTAEGDSGQVILVITSGELKATEKEYSELNCQDEDLVKSMTTTYSYEVGETTKDSTNKDAYKLDITMTGWSLHQGSSDGHEPDDMGKTYYFMFKFNNEQLLFSEDKHPNDGSSDAKRANVFGGDHYFLKR